MRIGNKELIKDINRSHVLNTIRQSDPLSRTDISKKVNLGLSTVTYIVEELMSENLIYEKGEGVSTGGRKGVLLQFNEQFGYAAAIKLEETRVLLSITDLNAQILLQNEVSFCKGESLGHVLPKLISGLDGLLVQLGPSSVRLLGISIVSSGLINGKDGKIIRSTLLGWENADIRSPIEEHFKVPVFLDNNVNAYLLAEKKFGFGRGRDNFLCISIGAGVGTSLSVNKTLYNGHHGGAGEFGHMIIYPNGIPCHCGQSGCLEMYASELFFQTVGPQEILDYPSSLLNGSGFSFFEVHRAARQGDELSIWLFKSLGENLGIGVLNLINLLNPQAIIFIGEGVAAKEFFLPYTQEIAQQNFFKKAGCATEIYVSELGDGAWLQGAALSAINHLFALPIYKKSELFNEKTRRTLN